MRRRSRIALERALRGASYEVLPLRGAEESVVEHVPRAVPLSVTVTEAKRGLRVAQNGNVQTYLMVVVVGAAALAVVAGAVTTCRTPPSCSNGWRTRSS